MSARWPRVASFAMLCAASATAALAQDAAPDDASPAAVDTGLTSPTPPASVKVTGAVNAAGRAAAPTLFGPSGQMYLPVGDNRWQRDRVGGVSGDVSAAFRTAGGKLFAIGSRTPLFERVDDVWYTRPLPNRGPVTVARGGAQVIAVGRHLYALKPVGWRRIVSAPGLVSALWAKSATQIVAASESGQVWRLRGKRWAKIAAQLLDGDVVVAIFGRRPSDLLAVSEGGSLVALSIGESKPAEVPPAIEGWLPDVGGDSGVGYLLLGTRNHEAGRSAHLVDFAGGAIRPLEAIAAPVAGDRFISLTVPSPKTLFLASLFGDLRVRKEGVWSTGSLAVSLPPPPAITPGSAPAETR